MAIIPAPTRRGQRTATSRMPRKPEVKEIVRPPGRIRLLSWCSCPQNRSPLTPKMDGHAGSSDGKLRVGLANPIQQTTCVRSKQQSQNRDVQSYAAGVPCSGTEHAKQIFVALRMATPPPIILWQCHGMPFACYTDELAREAPFRLLRR